MEIPPLKRKPPAVLISLNAAEHGEVKFVYSRVPGRFGDVFVADDEQWIIVAEVAPPKRRDELHVFQTLEFVRNDAEAAMNIIKGLLLVDDVPDGEGDEAFVYIDFTDNVRELEFSWVVVALPAVSNPTYSFEAMLRKEAFTEDEVMSVLGKRALVYGQSRYSKIGTLRFNIYKIYEIVGGRSNEVRADNASG